jgi:hypothetical protein
VQGPYAASIAGRFVPSKVGRTGRLANEIASKSMHQLALEKSRQRLMISCCTDGTCSRCIWAPRSPRATIAPSETNKSLQAGEGVNRLDLGEDANPSVGIPISLQIKERKNYVRYFFTSK